jgi:hypothetical protein
VFRDVPIQPFVTCGSNPPLGDVVIVRQKLRLAELATRGLDGSTPRLDVANSRSSPALVHPAPTRRTTARCAPMTH